MTSTYKLEKELSEEDVLKIKDKVYGDILQFLDIEGYPTEGSSEFTEANVSDLLVYIIGPILASFRRNTGRPVRLHREKEIVVVDNEMGGKEEFVIVDLVDVGMEKFVLMVEGKRSSLRQAERQCLLSMQDMRGNNGEGEVYGFTTTGESWRMFRYDGISFCKTEKMDVIFDSMDEGTGKERWIKDCSILVDCILMALRNGGGVKDVVIG